MKVGLLTFHRANNYGAVLQAYALQKYICDNICECEIIDFIPNNHVGGKVGVARKFLGFCKRFCKKIFIKDTSKKFETFRKELILSEHTYRGDKELMDNPPYYNVVISGSDQILNMTLSGNSYSYYLKPWTKSKKISYASSFGRSNLTEIEYQAIKNYISSFSYVSVREESAAKIIHKYAGVSAQTVMDPCFLLSREYWDERAGSVKLPSNYVLVYAMEYCEAMMHMISKEIEASNKVYVICGGQSAQQLPGIKLKNIGPCEFLAYIKNADLLLTNSFHGTAFAMIFGKRFFCVSHTTRNDRIQNILKLTDNYSRLIDHSRTDMYHFENEIDGYEAYSKLTGIIDSSKQYLRNSLGDINEQ